MCVDPTLKKTFEDKFFVLLRAASSPIGSGTLLLLFFGLKPGTELNYDRPPRDLRDKFRPSLVPHPRAMDAEPVSSAASGDASPPAAGPHGGDALSLLLDAVAVPKAAEEWSPAAAPPGGALFPNATRCLDQTHPAGCSRCAQLRRRRRFQHVADPRRFRPLCPQAAPTPPATATRTVTSWLVRWPAGGRGRGGVGGRGARVGTASRASPVPCEPTPGLTRRAAPTRRPWAQKRCDAGPGWVSRRPSSRRVHSRSSSVLCGPFRVLTSSRRCSEQARSC